MWDIRLKASKKLTILLILAALNWACAPEIRRASSFPNASCSERVSPVFMDKAEPDFCSSISGGGADPVTITGTAQYQARELYSGGLGDPGAARPIRHAEIEVVNGAGTRIQCGQTDASGNFSIVLPRSSSTHQIRVNSRADNEHYKASVLNCPEENRPYSLNFNFTPNESKSIGSQVATVTGEILGAAFNILDMILEANDFLRSSVSNCSNDFTGCTDFDVAEKVQAYWVPGYNPNNYFGASSGISFYLPGFKRLFILGGSNGNTNTVDTDHFDNSIILHEYGHFLEDVYTITNSPGGAHSGNRLIDPRLAWSEAWGNFIQAAILNDPRYVDTWGNIDGATGYIFNIPLDEIPEPFCTNFPNASGCDVPVLDDEGNFREFSITRFLWDVFDIGAFDEIWATMTWVNGLRNPAEAFRAVGLVLEVQEDKLAGSTDLSSIKTEHKHGDTTEYARYVEQDAVGCGTYSFTINPLFVSSDDGSFSTSHLLRNNNFYMYKHPGGPFNLTLTYLVRPDSGSEREPDIDLYVYRSPARYGNTNDMAGFSQQYWDNDPTTIETESISLSSLAAGDYLINTKIFTGRYEPEGGNPGDCIGSGAHEICFGEWIHQGSITDYRLEVNGEQLCDAPRP